MDELKKGRLNFPKVGSSKLGYETGSAQKRGRRKREKVK
jgi:hypothetical protein